MPCGTQLSAHIEPLLIGSTSIIITTCNATSHFDSTLQMKSAFPGCCIAFCYFPLPAYTSRPRYPNTTPVTRYKALYASDLTVCGHAVHNAITRHKMFIFYTTQCCSACASMHSVTARPRVQPSQAMPCSPIPGLLGHIMRDCLNPILPMQQTSYLWVLEVNLHFACSASNSLLNSRRHDGNGLLSFDRA